MFSGNDHVVLRIMQRFGAGGNRRLHQRGNFAAQVFHFALEAQSHLLKRHAAEMRIEVIAGFYQLAGREIAVGEQHPVLHIPLRRNDDDQHPLFRQTQKFDVAEYRTVTRTHDHPDKLRQARKHVRRIGNDLLRLIGYQRQRGFHVAHMFRFGGDQGIHKQAVSTSGRHPSGRCVGTGNQPQRLQIGHDVADGGWRELKPRRPGKRARAYRLAIGNVTVHQGLEQQLGTIIQHPGILMI